MWMALKNSSLAFSLAFFQCENQFPFNATGSRQEPFKYPFRYSGGTRIPRSDVFYFMFVKTSNSLKFLWLWQIFTNFQRLSMFFHDLGNPDPISISSSFISSFFLSTSSLFHSLSYCLLSTSLSLQEGRQERTCRRVRFKARSDTIQNSCVFDDVKEKVEFWEEVKNNLWALLILIMQVWKNIS